MRFDSSLVATHRGSTYDEPRTHTPHTARAPWGARGLPRVIEAGGPHRTLFRELLRRSEGVAITFPDGSTGRVAEVVFPVLDFDFWPEALLVGTPCGKRRVPVPAVAVIETRPPRIEIGRTDEQAVLRNGGPMPATIDVELEDREDAAALLERLDPFHPELVQLAPTRWRVHADAPGRRGESTSRALSAIEKTLAIRHVGDSPVRVNGQLYNPGSTSASDGPVRRATGMPLRSTTRTPSARPLSDLTTLARERNRHPLPHGPVDVSSAELDSLVPSREGYDNVQRGDAADFVRFVEGDTRVRARATFTHVLAKSAGTVVVEREYEEGSRVRIGTRELAFRANRFVYDPAKPDGPDLGFLTALRHSPRPDAHSTAAT